MRTTDPTPSQLIWKNRLQSSFRITIACLIIGSLNFYGPYQIRHQVKYPAFAYVTAILIVSDSTLGHTLRGAWLAFIATLLVLGPSVTTLWLIGPGNFKPYMAALAVFLGSFGVGLTESAPLLAKRVAFGQMVIVYVGTVVFGDKAGVVMHPVHVCASTGMGVFASVLAMLVPYPRLANREVRKKCTAYTENASQRIDLFVKAILTEDVFEARVALDEIKTMSERASILLRSIHRNQDALLWEKPHLRLLSRPNFKYPAQVLTEIELTLKAMETVFLTSYSISSFTTSSSTTVRPPQLKDEVQRVANRLKSRIKQLNNSLPFPELTNKLEPTDRRAGVDGDDENNNQQQTNYNDTTTPLKHLQILLFFLCTNSIREEDDDIPTRKLIKDIQNSSSTNMNPKSKQQQQQRRCLSSLFFLPSHNTLRFAFKCSASLGLAVFCGLTYTKPNGYWSGLTIAISFVQPRFSTFSSTNARAQGTALGSVYGLLAYVICHKFGGVVKLISLIPWIIFTTFLRKSKIYGEPGSISAVIAALLILGRRNYGTPTEFAIARLTEAFIGLSCFIVVEILMRPKRAAVLVRPQLGFTAGAIETLLQQMSTSLSFISQNKTDLIISSLTLLEETKIQTRVQVQKLNALIEEAKQEPNFWFRPFEGDQYTMVLNSVTKIADVSGLMTYAIQVLCLDLLQRTSAEWKGYSDQLSVDVQLFKRLISCPLKCIEQAMIPEGSSKHDQGGLNKCEEEEDIEMSKLSDQDSSNNICRVPEINKDEADIVLGSFLKHTIQITQSLPPEEEEVCSKHLVISLGSVLFCMRSLVTEMTSLNKEVNELIRKEKS